MSNQAAAINIDTFNKVVDYLSHRPYSEVSGLIDEIRNTTKVVNLTEEEESSQESSDEE
jgi:hypothetical protein